MTSIQDQIFTASNGLRVHTPNPGWLEVPDPRVGGKNLLSPSQVDALREYFTAVRDKELGRWRPPEHPSVVVYPSKVRSDLVHVFHEWHTICEVRVLDDLDPADCDLDHLTLAARAFFEAHPEPEPRPWEDAEDRSIWVLTIDGRDPEPFKWSDRTQQFTQVIGGFPIYSPERITAGYQVWPTPEAGDGK